MLQWIRKKISALAKALFRDCRQRSNAMRSDQDAVLPTAPGQQEMPLNPMPHAFVWLMVGGMLLTIVWAVFGKIDIVITAPGKIVPGIRTRIISPAETATVRKIHVSEGQAVKAGQTLVDIDPAADELNRMGGDLAALRLQMALARALLDALGGARPARLEPVAGVDREQMDEARILLDGQFSAYRSRQAGLELKAAKLEAELPPVMASVRKLEQSAPIARQRALEYKNVSGSRKRLDHTSQSEYLEREQARIEQESSLATLRNRSFEIKMLLFEAREQQKLHQAETTRNALDNFSAAQQKVAALRQDQGERPARAKSVSLAAPVDGMVQQLALHTVGSVITTGQQLMQIVPPDTSLEVEVFLEKRDIEFVMPGQDTSIKMESFDVAGRNVIPATVRHVSSEAISDAKHGMLYPVRLSVSRLPPWAESKQVSLVPGTIVTVELKAGQKSVIDYILETVL
ncbi:MAG: hlyD [Herminiimonas sp.]|nr:hlyD [Herminiimonas sp.]